MMRRRSGRSGIRTRCIGCELVPVIVSCFFCCLFSRSSLLFPCLCLLLSFSYWISVLSSCFEFLLRSFATEFYFGVLVRSSASGISFGVQLLFVLLVFCSWCPTLGVLLSKLALLHVLSFAALDDCFLPYSPLLASSFAARHSIDLLAIDSFFHLHIYRHGYNL